MTVHHATVKVSASCLCGAFRYELSGPFSHMADCHCSICRKHHNADHAHGFQEMPA